MQMFLDTFESITWQMPVMWLIGGILIYLAIKHDMEPTLLLPMGFGAILMNLPISSEVTYSLQEMQSMLSNIGMNVDQILANGGEANVKHVFDALVSTGAIEVEKPIEGVSAVLHTLYKAGIANELFPLLLFIGIGAMIDFGPLLSNPKMLLIGAAAQFGIFFTLSMARLLGFDMIDAASIGIIGAADGPTSIVVANTLGTKYVGAIMVAAYSYMALVPIVQPPFIKLATTKKERLIRMPYNPGSVSKGLRIMFPICVTIVAALAAPAASALVGFLMFGNLIRECGVLDSLSNTAQNVLANLITIFLGITVAFSMKGSEFLRPETLMILGLGLVAFIADTVFGVFFVKFLNLFTKNKMNPMIGAAGISAFPMASRVVHKMGLKEDPQNFLLMHAAGANVAGQIASAIVGGLIIGLVL